MVLPLTGTCLRADIYNAISLLFLAVALYAGLFLSIGRPFLPSHGDAWAIIFIWFSALVLGMALDRVSHSAFWYSLSLCKGCVLATSWTQWQSIALPLHSRLPAPQIHVPAPLGMIVAGIMLKNINNGSIIAGLKPSWSKEFRGMALAIIFLRSGLELDLGVSQGSETS